MLEYVQKVESLQKRKESTCTYVQKLEQVLADLRQHVERMADDAEYHRAFTEAAEDAIRAVNELAEERRHASAISPELRRAPCDC